MRILTGPGIYNINVSQVPCSGFKVKGMVIRYLCPPRGGEHPVQSTNELWIPACAGMTKQPHIHFCQLRHTLLRGKDKGEMQKLLGYLTV